MSCSESQTAICYWTINLVGPSAPNPMLDNPIQDTIVIIFWTGQYNNWVESSSTGCYLIYISSNIFEAI